MFSPQLLIVFSNNHRDCSFFGLSFCVNTLDLSFPEILFFSSDQYKN